MQWHKDTLSLATKGKGLYPFTDQISRCITRWDILDGICHLFVQHTSASLVISESYDPSARIDLENSMERLIPENQSWYRHTIEGSDDSPSHIRAMLTNTSISIPIDAGRLSLGTWQGVYLFEHRQSNLNRQILVRCLRIN